MTIRGVVGRIEWYGHGVYDAYVAAAIDGYTVSGAKEDNGTWSLTARIVSHDAAKLELGKREGRLRFVAPHQKGLWMWPINTLTIVNGQVSARLGAPMS